MHTVSPWSITVQMDIENSASEKVFHENKMLKPFKKNAKMHEYNISGFGLIKVQW